MQSYLPSLDTVLADIRSGIRQPLYWGKREAQSVPVVRCRHCNTLRADDGTRCSAIISGIGHCETYQYPEIQAKYAAWQQHAPLDGASNRNFTPAKEYH